MSIEPFFCTNIFPGESIEEAWAILKKHLPVIRKLSGRDGQPFPIGLRLSAQAAEALMELNTLRKNFGDWLKGEGYEVFAMNGFPYGTFHGKRLKEQVFLPDWQSERRWIYTQHLFLLMDEWAEEERSLTVSTLPGSHKIFAREDEDLLHPIREMGRFLAEFSEETGRDCTLGFEPEPFGHFEDTEESIRFLNKIWEGERDEVDLRYRLGITYDTCHFALEYEEAKDSLDRFNAAGIRIPRIQASNALSLTEITKDSLSFLEQFNEPVYFHQVNVLMNRETREIKRFEDMGEALVWGLNCLDEGRPCGDEWRCHFHIPISRQPETPLRDTQQHLKDVITYQKENENFSPEWETETYTWTVLPQQLRQNIDEQIAEELLWLRNQFA